MIIKDMKKIILLFLFSISALAQVPNLITESFKQGLFSFYSNEDFLEDSQSVNKVIITIHGSARNPLTYFKSIYRISQKAGLDQNIIVIAPHFKASGDEVLKKEHVFSYEGWWIGNQSLNYPSISSFEVMEKLVETYLKKYPTIKEVILTGHSAGGHFTQRLALGATIDKRYPNINFKFIVANPGTYTYLNNKRPVINHPGQFEIPLNPRCAYNNYKYGLEKLNRYMSNIKVPQMISSFIKRNVTYFLGEQDIGEVEQTCEAKLQGPNRFVRGKNFKDHVDLEYPENRHHILTVPGVGHTQYGMYTSEEGKQLLLSNQL